MASTGGPGPIWSSLERLARAYEADPEKRRDLSQDIHFQLWRSFQNYDSRCSLRTWVYRVAHHVAVSHVIRERRIFSNLVSLEELDILPDKARCAVRRRPADGFGPAIGVDSAAQTARSSSHCFLSRRHGCGIHWGDHGLVAREHGHENSSNQERPREAIPPSSGTREETMQR